MACAEIVTSSSMACWLSTSPFRCMCSRWIIDSTMITAPSTINPKSIAPKLMRLAETPKICISAKANNKLNGMTDATIKPARQLPSNSTRINTTIRPPSIKFFSTVEMDFPINTLRSKKGTILIPWGIVFWISSMRTFTSLTTLFALAPFSNNITAPTTSPFPFRVIAP